MKSSSHLENKFINNIHTCNATQLGIIHVFHNTQIATLLRVSQQQQ